MVNEAKERGEGTIMVDTNLTYPGWLRILITAIITAVCTAGVLAAILVWQLTPPPPSSSSTSSSSSSSSSGLPSPAAVADDAGGEGSAPLNQENPFRKTVKIMIIFWLKWAKTTRVVWQYCRWFTWLHLDWPFSGRLLRLRVRRETSIAPPWPWTPSRVQ